MSGFFNGNISGITRFQIAGFDRGLPMGGLSDFDEKIKAGAFCSFFPENAEKNVGFVSIDDCLDSNLTPENTMLGAYRVFSLRVDRRTVAASSLKIRTLEETKKHLQKTGKRRLLRIEREEIRDCARAELLKNTPPVTAICDVLVHTGTGLVYVASLINNMLQEVQDAFRRVFRLTLQLHEPISHQSLDKTGLSPSSFGREFMTWLWFKSQQEETIAINGSASTVVFTRRIVLASGEGDYAETVVCSGIHADLKEAKEALRQGKKVKEARIKIYREEMTWELGCRGDSFQFQAVKLPPAAGTEEEETRRGMNLERLFLMMRLIGTMDLLLEKFFELRVSPAWPDEFSAMHAWASET